MFGFVQNNDGDVFGLLDVYYSRIPRQNDAGLYKLLLP